MTSLAARRRIDSARPSRQDRLANRFVHDTSDEESEDEETRLQREEEEQERLLSEANGEAAEAATTTKTQTDQEIEAEYATTAKKRKPRLTLQPKHVIGADGLLKIRSDFVALKKPKTLSIDAAASYSRRLVLKYKSWSYDLFPSLAFEDVLSRVETFGPKREVKAHLQSMRNDVRNAYLEKIMGKDLAARMIDELEDGLRKQEEVGQEVVPEEESAPPSTPVEPRITRATTTTETARTPPAAIVDSDSEEELEFARAPTSKATKPTAADFMDTDDEEEIGAKPSKTTATLVDTDDEGEDEVSTKAAEKDITVEHDPKDLQGDTQEQAAGSIDKVASADEEEVGVNNDTNQMEQAEATSVDSSKETNVHDDDVEMEVNEEAQTVTTTQSEVAEPVPTQNSTTASQLERSPSKSQTQDDVTADVESPQTQATELASQLESVAKTREKDEATPPSPTQATVLASQIESSPEQLTQATILASQTQQELSTQDTVLATQEQTQATVIASQLVEPTQATLLASQLETQEDLVSQTQATVLASPESEQKLPTQTQEEPAIDALVVSEFQTQND